MRLLVVEDDVEISNILKTYLENSLYEVDQAFDGNEALEKFFNKKYDLVVLDMMLPFISGEEILEKIRAKSLVPVIILSAKTSEKNKLDGLIRGADDYVTKPFSAKEVVARVDANLRRVKEYNVNSDVLMYDDSVLRINFEEMKVEVKGEEIVLTANELKVMKVFVINENIVLSREQIIEIAFEDFDGYDRNIDTYIKNIRSKIGKDYIKTVYSMGYKFTSVKG